MRKFESNAHTLTHTTHRKFIQFASTAVRLSVSLSVLLPSSVCVCVCLCIEVIICIKFPFPFPRHSTTLCVQPQTNTECQIVENTAGRWVCVCDAHVNCILHDYSSSLVVTLGHKEIIVLPKKEEEEECFEWKMFRQWMLFHILCVCVSSGP